MKKNAPGPSAGKSEADIKKSTRTPATPSSAEGMRKPEIPQLSDSSAPVTRSPQIRPLSIQPPKAMEQAEIRTPALSTAQEQRALPREPKPFVRSGKSPSALAQPAAIETPQNRAARVPAKGKSPGAGKFDFAKMQASLKGFSATVKQKMADSQAKTLAKRKAAAEEAIAQREMEKPSVPLSPFAASQKKRRSPRIGTAQIDAGTNEQVPNVVSQVASSAATPVVAPRAARPQKHRQALPQSVKPQQRPSQSAQNTEQSDFLYQKPNARQTARQADVGAHPVFGLVDSKVGGGRTKRSSSRELSNLHNELKRHVKGKPSRPVHMMSIPAIVGRSIGRAIKIAIFIVIMAILFTGGAGVGVLMGYINTTVPVDMSQLKSGPLTSYMYDLSGNLMAKYTGPSNIDRVDITYDSVKGTYIDDAFIAIEDERFLTNIGIDPKRIGSAIVSALANGGTPTHGGSTITQQTVKLVTGEDDVSAQRKIQEWYKAIQLTQSLTKDEIMGTYLNLVPMGNSYVGIEAAAQGYFNKSAIDLTLEECAYLAAIPRGPSLYNPRTESGLRNGLRRQRIVLGNMYNLGMISQAQYRQALNTELKFIEKPPAVSGTSVNSYYSEYALEQVVKHLAKKLDITTEAAYNMVTSKGVTIYAALEPEVQGAIDRAMNREEIYNSNPDQYADSPEKPQLGQVIINNLTGTIAGMGGGTGAKTANLVLNRATDIHREPGSTIKPLAVYAPAIDQRTVTGATVFVDEPVFLLGGDKPWPNNLGGTYYGRVTVRNAVKWSLNIESAQVLNTIGPEVAKQYLYEMGMDRRTDGVALAMAMGSFDVGMSPLEVAGGYYCLANNGMYSEPLAYTKVLAHDGTVLLEAKHDFKQVFTPETAYMMTSILRETLLPANSSFGYGGTAAGTIGLIRNANGEDIYTVGKSGTTEYQWDRWFSGYSAYYSTSVWYGFDTPTVLNENSYDYRAPEYVFRDTMNDIHANLEPRDFERPATIISLDICNQSGLLANPQCGNNVQTEVFDVNSPRTPNTNCNIHYYRAPAPVATQPAATTAAAPPAEPAPSQ